MAAPRRADRPPRGTDRCRPGRCDGTPRRSPTVSGFVTKAQCQRRDATGPSQGRRRAAKDEPGSPIDWIGDDLDHTPVEPDVAGP